jgi:hypothetical protein
VDLALLDGSEDNPVPDLKCIGNEILSVCGLPFQLEEILLDVELWESNSALV